MKYELGAICAALMLFSPVHAGERGSKEDLHVLFSKLAGEWRCEGAFADGRPLAADISMKTDHGGNVLLYRHEDHPPTSYKASGVWFFDDKDNNFAALRHRSVGGQAAVSAYIGDSWDDTTLTFKAKALWGPLWAENRFTFTIEDVDEMSMVWEVAKDAEWRMGDYLDCRK